MSANVDALGRVESAPPRGGRAGARVLLFALVLGAMGWAFLLLRPALFPAREVATAAVRVEAGGAATFGVEATGWIEPDPFEVAVRPLVDGVVESVDVLEGARVERGVTVVARLRSVPLERDLDRAERTLALREAEVLVADAAVAEAEALLAQRLDLRREAARFAGEEARAEADVEAAAADVEVARAAVEMARLEVVAQEDLERSGSGTQVPRAKARAALTAAEADLAVRRGRLARARAGLVAARAERAVADEGVQTPAALEGALARARARLAAARADRDLATTERDIAAQLAGLLVVKAPVDGVVLRRDAVPGMTVGPAVMGRGEGAEARGTGSVVTVYDPAHLQARVDVLLAEVGSVGVGRAAEVSLETFPGRVFHGSVIRVQSEADVLKNTLQVKVRIDDPDPLLRPEMVCRARFAAPAQEGERTAVRTLVPSAAVRGGDHVLVLDPRSGGRARRVAVTVVGREADLSVVRGDLASSNEVVLTPDVSEGDRVRGIPR